MAPIRTCQNGCGRPPYGQAAARAFAAGVDEKNGARWQVCKPCLHKANQARGEQAGAVQ